MGDADGEVVARREAEREFARALRVALNEGPGIPFLKDNLEAVLALQAFLPEVSRKVSRPVWDELPWNAPWLRKAPVRSIEEWEIDQKRSAPFSLLLADESGRLRDSDCWPENDVEALELKVACLRALDTIEAELAERAKGDEFELQREPAAELPVGRGIQKLPQKARHYCAAMFSLLDGCVPLPIDGETIAFQASSMFRMPAYRWDKDGKRVMEKLVSNGYARREQNGSFTPIARPPDLPAPIPSESP